MNPQKIKGRIVEAGLTQGRAATLIGMSGNSLSRKLTGKRDFTLSEIVSLCTILKITDPIPYFFESLATNTQQNA